MMVSPREAACREKLYYPTRLSDLEDRAVEKRRLAAGLTEGTIPRARIGLALSGGGIRSATFSLGVLQGLARAGVLRRVDYLSTVSGGGYIGSFLGRLFCRPWINEEKKEAVAATEGPVAERERLAVEQPTAAERVEEVLMDPARRAVDWLRENGRYLSPNGGGDLLLAFSIVVRNWVAIHVVLATFVLTLLLALQTPRAVWPWLRSFDGGDGVIWWSEFVAIPVLIFLLAVVPLGWAYWLGQRRNRLADDFWFEPRWTGLPFVFFALVAVATDLVRPLIAAADRGRPSIRPLFCPEAVWLLGLLNVLYLVALLAIWWAERPSKPVEPPASKEANSRTVKGPDLAAEGCDGPNLDRSRNNKLSQWLRSMFMLAGITLLVALVDSLGRTAYVAFQLHAFELAPAVSDLKTRFAAGGLASLVVFGRKLATFISDRSKGKRLSVPLDVLATAAAVVLIFSVLVTLSVVSYGLASSFGPVGGTPPKGLTTVVSSAPEARVIVSGAAQVVVVMTPGGAPVPDGGRAGGCSGLLWWSLGIGVGMTACFAKGLPFLNQSSLQALYAARLTRAYLGASNPLRWSGTGGAWISEPLPGDGIALEKYHPEVHGGPLHLINVTVNETVSGKSQLEQRDRKGLGMAIGPLGVSVGTRHHAEWENGKSGCATLKAFRPTASENEEPAPPAFQIFPTGQGTAAIEPEPLDVGTWVSISGAATSTGMGARTSLGLSLLCGFFNVRTGYWWNSGVEPESRRSLVSSGPESHGLPVSPRVAGRLEPLFDRFLTVQKHLLDELLARFHGPSRRRWYLSDGGHFENTGAYELIRRRLPLIILCDDGADPEFRFNDLANLVRKARLDFATEIELLDSPEILDEGLQDALGTLEQLRPVLDPADPSKPKRADRHAAIARVRYPVGEPGVLILMKPTIVGNEPADVVEYAARHQSFPQEPTSDQYFDEAQWESYRKLGYETAWPLAGLIMGRFDQRSGSFLGARPEETRP